MTQPRVNIFDIGAVDQHNEMYEAWVFPELHVNQPQPVLSNWHPEDLAAYCGGMFTIGYNERIAQ